MDLFSVIRQGRVYMVVAILALATYQQRLADQFGIKPGRGSSSGPPLRWPGNATSRCCWWTGRSVLP